MKPPLSEPDQVPLDGAVDDRSGDGQTGDSKSGPGLEAPRGAAMKYLYPSGSKPLDGYTIKRGVGRGGFGEVYFATSDAGKEVALKLIRRNLDVELRGVRHCLNLKHPNLIGLYDIRNDDLDDQWVVMEYVSGQSMEDVIEAHPAGMPVEQVVWWMRGIAAGVGYLHDHGIVHRDLKPGNIFLDHDSSPTGAQSGVVSGTVKIGDYGLSKFISCSRRSGQTESVGTVHYMAPEIANGRYGREIDTYAIGVMLYEMLTGHVPFEGESVGEVLMKHLTAEPVLDSVPEPFREIIKRALAKDPELRISSVYEIVEMLPGASVPVAPAGLGGHQAFKPSQESLDTGEYERFAGYDYDERRHRSSRRPSFAPTGPRGQVEEPLYAGLRGWLGGLARQFSESDLPTPAKVIALLVFALFVTPLLGYLVVPLIGLLMVYGVYYAIWLILIKPGAQSHAERMAQPPGPAEGPRGDLASRVTDAGAPPRPKAAHRRPKPWREVVHHQIKAKSGREIFTELLGSMLLSAILCVVLSGVGTALILGDSSAGAWQATHLWMSIVTTLGCWGVLATGKLTEGRVEDQAPMRVMQLGVGLAVGLAAFGLTDGLSLTLPIDSGMGPDPTHSLLGKVSHSQQEMMTGWGARAVAPSAAVSLIYYGLLFTLPRWWRVAEFTRDKRLSLWSSIGLVVWAWLLHLVWWYPQPVGMAIAAVVAVTVQLASPWFPPSKRAELARQRAAI